MIKRILALGIVLVLAATAWAMNARYSSGTGGISVTQANTNTAFTDNRSGSGTSATFQARHVLIRSRSTSANTCFFDLGDGVATTADTRLEPGAAVSLDWDEYTGGGAGWWAIGTICSSGQTATFDVDAWR